MTIGKMEARLLSTAFAMALAGGSAGGAPPSAAPAGAAPPAGVQAIARVAGDRVRIEVGLCTLEAPPAARAHLEPLARRAAPVLARIETELGAAPAAPYRIVLIPGGRQIDPEIVSLDAAAPPWAAGFLLPERRVGAIRIALADSYPHADLASVLAHEATHMILHDAAGEGMPRWFGEGVATAVEREWGMRDLLVYSSSLLTGVLPELSELDAAFDATDDRARTAYAASFDFVLWTVRRYGDGAVRGIVREARHRPFPGAWKAATGVALSRSEAEWRRGSLLLYRWVPALTGSTALWIGITFLALAAGARRRARSRAILERWDADERGTSTDRDDGM